MTFKEYMELFMIFAKIGAFTFGGGFAMIPIIEKELVMNKKWINQDEIINLFAVSQSIPGAIAINTSTLVGYKVGNKRGAIIATLGVVLPSFLIILVIATFFTRISDSKIVEAVFTGINGAVIVMILMASVRMIKAGVKDRLTLTIMIITVVAIIFFNMSPIIMIIIGCMIGCFQYLRRNKHVGKTL